MQGPRQCQLGRYIVKTPTSVAPPVSWLQTVGGATLLQCFDNQAAVLHYLCCCNFGKSFMMLLSASLCALP